MNNEIIADEALKIAQSQIGASEQPAGSNSGPMVNEYLKSVGLNPGYAWCQAFVYWCYNAAAKKAGKQNPAIKTASVHDCWNRSHTANGVKRLLKEDVMQQPDLIKPGDQFVLFFGEKVGHTGIIEWIERETENGPYLLHTIEGNSNNDGSREGYEVVRHKRHINDKALQGFIQYS